MRLILGAGTRQKDGWHHHDVQDLPGIDFVCDFWKIGDFVDDDTCSEIEMTHMLEHFPMKHAHRALKKVWGLLQPGGRLYIEVPNFQWHAEEILKDPLNRQMVEYAFGGQLNEWDFHYNGFTPDILAQDLANAGFRVDNLQPNSSIECYATKII
jgi:hypothetical protein